MALNVANLQQLASALPAEVQQPLGAALRAQDKLNLDIGQQLNGLAFGGWVQPTLLNGWTNISGDSQFLQLQYRTEPASGSGVVVRCQGRIANGTVGVATPVFVLPQALLPLNVVIIPISSNGVFGRVRVDNATGGVSVLTGSNVSADLNFSFAAGG